MRELERRARKRRLYGSLQAAVLSSLAVSGIVLVATFAPGLPGALAKLPSIKRAQLRYQCRSALGRLVQEGRVVFEEREGKKYARITPAGRKALQFEREKAKLMVQEKRRWDKQWRVVVFDIAERRRLTRDHLRKLMQEIGFVRLQDSVWVFPYDCEEFVALLKAELKIGSAVLYMIVDQIENDRHLRAHFGLA